MRKSAYRITIDNLKFLTIIGILEDERINPQEVVVSCAIDYSREKEGFINYAMVAEKIKSTMVKKKFFLIEDALESIAALLKEEFSMIDAIKLKILKPDILEDCVVGVEIFKKY